MALVSIRRLLPAALRAAGISEQATAARVVHEADQVIRRLWGEEKAAYVRIVSFSGGVLKFGSLSGAALHELGMQRVQIQNEINRILGSKIVTKIVTHNL